MVKDLLNIDIDLSMSSTVIIPADAIFPADARTLQEKPKLNFIDEFSKFFTSSLYQMTEEQRDICIALGLDCVRMGKCETFTADHQLVTVAESTQVSN